MKYFLVTLLLSIITLLSAPQPEQNTFTTVISKTKRQQRVSLI